ncbi:uncharacterized protein A1O9_01787 [Exophiala aquamarina CBS 119918]|uniref:Glycosyl transferase CAP10 domain-containing protein n=1 Tax=Exophiala aquamarina CBS 119918 TaxID=1182545 RepID=A0A072PUS4_9EURO|nr:uncharacterized protein A1O9_01787 [Exophiala aquamarina CBS 119918]KEF63809.1 hypothetical protein A1O9_01787 [Exophiala aquamarina CBS 119918]
MGNLPIVCYASKNRGGYTSLPLNDISNVEPQLATASDTNQGQGKVRITVLTVTVLALSSRLELYRRITKATECTTDNAEVFLPFLIALYDAARSQKWRTLQGEKQSDPSFFGLARRVTGPIQRPISTWILQPRTRYLLPLFLIASGCYLVQGMWHSSTTTYICPIVTGELKIIPLFQFLALLLDFLIAIIVYETHPKSDGSGLSGRRCVVLWSSSLLGVSFIWSGVGAAIYLFKPEYRGWLLLLRPSLDFGTFVAMGVYTFLFCLLFISTLHCIMIYGVLDMSICITAIMTMIPGFEFIWSHIAPYPPVSKTASIASFFVVLSGWWMYRRIQQALGEREPLQRSRQALALIILCILIVPAWRKNDNVHFHPIDVLIYDAKLQHDRYIRSVGSTNSLLETVARYQKRYKRNPPPGFDKWFEFAKTKSAFVVDEFDQIYEDLLPFRTVPPEVIRKQTWEMVSNPWNEISGITIRNGSAAVQENVLPTHRWMLEGVANLINKFSQHLPDMDLAFNLNDESRVAVPFHDIERLRQQGRIEDKSGPQSWSPERDAGWLPIPEHDVKETVFRDMSFRNTFRAFGSVGCDPKSLAQTTPHVSSQSHICHSCTAPHSLGQFVADWRLAADICHQPDLAYLHGFYLSPAAFKTSYQLMPVFSQSKPHGYNDILYPSAWNYMDKVVYAPSKDQGAPGQEGFRPGFPDLPFSKKETTLFWRGATSEGVSSGNHAWRGMTRQRLVHMANNLTTSSHDSVTILLPHATDSKTKYKYQTIPGLAVKALGLHTDIAIVDHIARCGGVGLHDCTDQEKEFLPIPPTDFQAHWRYKFLFDLDGAGFSGRFLPFLQSQSLPFKTALFREWYDSRLTAWQHFVPQDLRLHGVWSTLAYFAGVSGSLSASGGKKVNWPAHVDAAERIALQGRDWANKVVRKEDMEIYFFRLLLEWGRLVDDRRDELGFVVAGGEARKVGSGNGNVP